MQVFKFGGASVKSSEAVENVAKIIRENGVKPLLVVVSAMGKTTNNLEKLVQAIHHKKKEKQDIFNEIKLFHENILKHLVSNSPRHFFEVENLFIELECQLDADLEELGYDELYDRIVPFGELISTKIINTFLNSQGLSTRWIDARNFIKTDQKFTKASISWNATQDLIQKRLLPIVKKQVVITQGFIGRSSLGLTTTLGREGSDYSASIFAHALNAKAVTIWKDVLGIYNGDPKRISQAKLISKLGYHQAIELAYYGASIIHPKTVQPLKEKGIPLYVKSFIESKLPGTHVGIDSNLSLPSCFIFKDNQALVKFRSKDFSFIVENHITNIFKGFSELGISVNLIQNAAISFRCVVENESNLRDKIIDTFGDKFLVEVDSAYQLLTIYNSSSGEEKEFLGNKKILLEQKNSSTAQYLIE